MIGVLVAVALAVVLFGIVLRPGHDGVSRVAGRPVLVVLSGSMTGVFNPGDLILDSSVGAEQSQRLSVGDIVTFHVSNTRSNNLITHRIVAVNEVGGQVAYQTKGDANNAADSEMVTPQQVVGVYTARVPYVGYVLLFAQSKALYVALLGAGLILLVVLHVAKYWTEHGVDDDSATTETRAREAAEPALTAGQHSNVEPTGLVGAGRGKISH